MTEDNPGRKLKGWLDSLEYSLDVGWVVRGWAADPNDFDRRLTVAIMRDGDVLATARAEQRRDDLRDGGVGDGCHGFEATIQRLSFADIETVALSLAVAGTDGDVIETRSFDTGLTGRLEGLEGIVVIGWALDPRAPSRPIALDMIIDGVTEGRVEANLFREDLAERGGGDHGFEWLLPEAYIDGLPHRLTVRVTNQVNRVLGEIRDIRVPLGRVTADVKRKLSMRSAASARARSVEQELLSEGRHLSANDLIGDCTGLLERLRLEAGHETAPSRGVPGLP